MQALESLLRAGVLKVGESPAGADEPPLLSPPEVAGGMLHPPEVAGAGVALPVGTLLLGSVRSRLRLLLSRLLRSRLCFAIAGDQFVALNGSASQFNAVIAMPCGDRFSFSLP